MVRTSIISVLALLAATGTAAAANRTEVTKNRVNVSAVSGENRAKAVTGNASAAAKIKTTVNDQRVESISIETKATASEEKIEQRVATSTENGALRIETTVEVKAHAAPASATTTTSQRYRQPPTPGQTATTLPTAGAAVGLFDAIRPELPWSYFFLRIRNFLTHAFRFP